MVNKENMRLWVEALESGNYQQGHGELRYDNRYCCLGVACEVAIAHGVELRVAIYSLSWQYDGTTRNLPNKVVQWLGLTSIDPTFVSENKNHTAIRANDDLGWDFAQIATALREYYQL